MQTNASMAPVAPPSRQGRRRGNSVSCRRFYRRVAQVPTMPKI